jgi:hypothetical protein
MGEAGTDAASTAIAAGAGATGIMMGGAVVSSTAIADFMAEKGSAAIAGSMVEVGFTEAKDSTAEAGFTEAEGFTA